jgi:UDP-glucuronate 4-epimerase
MRIIVTGNAGFIGSVLSLRLLNEGHDVIGVDNFNSDIYDSSFKYKNVEQLFLFTRNFTQISCDLLDYDGFGNADAIIHLAGYANVRMSFVEPEKFVRNNVETTAKILKDMNPETRLIYASSSSVYGESNKIPFEESDPITNIISPYAQTKKMCEDLVEMYCRVKHVNAIGLRFFTVYGRPDMAVYQFMQNIAQEKSITVYGDGTMSRDFTHVDDIVDGIFQTLFTEMYAGEHKIYNLGNSSPISLNQLIAHIELVVGKKAIIQTMAVPDGDVSITYANIDKAKRELGFDPKIGIERGLRMLFQKSFGPR